MVRGGYNSIFIRNRECQTYYTNPFVWTSYDSGLFRIEFILTRAETFLHVIKISLQFLLSPYLKIADTAVFPVFSIIMVAIPEDSDNIISSSWNWSTPVSLERREII